MPNDNLPEEIPAAHPSAASSKHSAFSIQHSSFVIPLWPGGAPGSETRRRREREYTFAEPQPHRVVRNVSEPSLTVFLPQPGMASGDCVIICPGGAHQFLSIDHEGYEVARWLNQRGIAACVLLYRVLETPDDDAKFLEYRASTGQPGRLQALLRGHWPLALADGQQAMRVARRRAAEWGLQSGRIGMLGFSAGGHVAAGVALAAEPDSRPDFVAPIYGALWENVVVPPDAPPLFMALAGDDGIAVEPSLTLYRAWHAAGRPAELHIYAGGGHGFGMFTQGLPSDGWIERFYEWLTATM